MSVDSWVVSFAGSSRQITIWASIIAGLSTLLLNSLSFATIYASHGAAICKIPHSQIMDVRQKKELFILTALA